MKLSKRVLLKTISKIELVFKRNWLSLTIRDRYADSIESLTDKACGAESIAIIVQGPIVEKDGFTLNTLKIYRKRYPRVKIVLSTWKGVSESFVKKLTDLDIDLLLNEEPTYKGISNINLQIMSTKSGINHAMNNGVEYCLKTRTDQRIYRRDFLGYFMSLLAIFRPNNTLMGNRLVTVSLNTFKYRLYGVTDMFMFGAIDDMWLYWNAEYDSRTLEDINHGNTLRDFSKAMLCEVYLNVNFLKKVKFPVDFTIKNYWKSLADLFIVIDKSSIDLFWFKYNRWDEHGRFAHKGTLAREELMFLDWINMYNDMIIYNESEEANINIKVE
jgi:hypothetical protein